MRKAIYLLLLGAMLGVMAWMTLVTLPQVQAQAGGLQPFDLRSTGYSEAEARAFLAALTPEGRAVYLGPQHLLDTFFPPLLAAVLAWSLLALLPRGWALAGAAMAVAGAGLDLVENALVTGLLTTDAPAAEAIARASTVTMSKSGLLTLAMLLLVVALVRRGLARLRGR